MLQWLRCRVRASSSHAQLGNRLFSFRWTAVDLSRYATSLTRALLKWTGKITSCSAYTSWSLLSISVVRLSPSSQYESPVLSICLPIINKVPTLVKYLCIYANLVRSRIAALSCVYTMQPVVQPAVQPVVQPAASCKHSCSWLYNRLYNHLSKSFWIFIICVRPRYIIRLQPPFWHGETKCWWCTCSYFCRCSSSGYRNN